MSFKSNRRSFALRSLSAALFAGLGISAAQAQSNTIKVGVLHSLSGTMAISETAKTPC